jgi:hypothetical protein
LRWLDSRRLTALVVLVSLAASVARTVGGGQDLNFDLITYHYYLGFSAFSDRLPLDFLAAGAAGYQSPLPYVLLYFLDSAGVPPILNAALHACLHALSLVLLFLLARVMVRGTALEHNRAAWVAFWLLGAVAPIYWQLVGTSFADALTSVLLLAALWLTAESLPAASRPGSLKLLAVAACLAGIAVAARVHNAIFVLALGGALLLVRFPDSRMWLRYVAVFAGACAGAWLLSFAPWAWRVYREFGNPIFPLFNGFFASADYPAVNLRFVGFVPQSAGDLLLLPFRMATYQEWRFGEKPFPDVRPALLVLSAAAGVLALMYRKLTATIEAKEPSQARRLVLVFFAIGALLWLVTSSNSRYGMPLFLLAGPVCGVLLYRFLPLRYVYVVVGAAVLWQVGQQQMYFTQYRWASGPWAERYFDWQVPSEVAARPAVYLGFGYKGASSLAPRVHPASRHAALVAQYSIGLDHPSAQRIRTMLDAPVGNIYGVFDYYYTQQTDPAAKSMKTYFDEQLRLWGLEFTGQACAPIALKPVAGVFRGQPPQYILCELRAAPAAQREAALARYRQFEAILPQLAAACPRLLGEAVSVVRVHGQWQVTSFASAEYRLEFDDDGAVNLQLLRPPYSTIALGKVARGKIALREPGCVRVP